VRFFKNPIPSLEMEQFTGHTDADIRSRHPFLRSAVSLFSILLTACSLIGWPTSACGSDASSFAYAMQPEHVLHGFESYGAMVWGHRSSSNPGAAAWRRYASILGSGIADETANRRLTVEAISIFAGDPRCGYLLARICRKPQRMFPAAEKAPAGVAAQSREAPPDRDRRAATLSLREEFRVYLVRRGDSLWDIAKRFDMNQRALAKINGLNAGAVLQVGRPLKVKALSSRELQLDLSAGSLAKHPSLLNHIRMIDGRPVPHWLVTDFVADVIDKRPPGTVNGDWGGPTKNLTIVIQFQLVKNLLEGRARQYEPLVLTHAERYDIDPALIMAMIHTESNFNPKARSQASAYGLMQLVPQTAGREAYYRVYGQRRILTPQYLYDPNNNIELGAAYLHILMNRYLRSIANPLSRTYCIVAAYHAGPSSVGRAFIPTSSLQRAIPTINSLAPADVYQRLVQALPSIESRNYVRSVIKRLGRYSGWYAEGRGTQI
jgi:hypothetical protein